MRKSKKLIVLQPNQSTSPHRCRWILRESQRGKHPLMALKMTMSSQSLKKTTMMGLLLPSHRHSTPVLIVHIHSFLDFSRNTSNRRRRCQPSQTTTHNHRWTSHRRSTPVLIVHIHTFLGSGRNKSNRLRRCRPSQTTTHNH